MSRRFIAVAAFLYALLAGAPVLAQDVTPSPSPTPLGGFSARGTLSLEVHLATASPPLGMSAQVAVMAKARRVRMDVLRFAAGAAQNGSSDMVRGLLPTGTISIVFNEDSGIFAIWSDQKREYFESKTEPPPSTQPTPKPTPSNESPVDQIMKGLRSVTEYDSFNESMSLIGHQPVNGHLASVYRMTVQSQKHGGKRYDFTSEEAFADDLSGIPVRFWITSKGDYDGTLRLDLLSATTRVPDSGYFHVPAGYKKAASIMELFSKAP